MTIFSGLIGGELSAELVLEGSKTMTWRWLNPKHQWIFVYDQHVQVIALKLNGRMRYAVGRTYSVQEGRAGKVVGKFLLTGIRQRTPAELTADDLFSEGFIDLCARREFYKCLAAIHNSDIGKVPNLPGVSLSFELVPAKKKPGRRRHHADLR